MQLYGSLVNLSFLLHRRKAEHKGATASQYGLVFGIFELTVFVASPFFGKYVILSFSVQQCLLRLPLADLCMFFVCTLQITKLNPKFMFNTGLFVSGACSILFG